MIQQSDTPMQIGIHGVDLQYCQCHAPKWGRGGGGGVTRHMTGNKPVSKQGCVFQTYGSADVKTLHRLLTMRSQV